MNIGEIPRSWLIVKFKLKGHQSAVCQLNSSCTPSIQYKRQLNLCYGTKVITYNFCGTNKTAIVTENLLYAMHIIKLFRLWIGHGVQQVFIICT